MRALRYAMSEIRKHANRVGFNVAEAEVQGGSDHTKSLGMLGHAGMSGKVRAAVVFMARLRFSTLEFSSPFVTQCAGSHDGSKGKRKSQYRDAKATWSYGQQCWWQRCNEWSQLNRGHKRAHRHGF